MKDITSNKILFVIWVLQRLWMKWIWRKKLESDWIAEIDKEEKAELPHENLPLLKGTSVDKRIWSILDRERLVVSENDSLPVVNVDRLGRSIHYININ